MNENRPTTVPVGHGPSMSGFIRRDQVYRPARRDRFVGRYLGVQNQFGSGNSANLNPPRRPRPSPPPRPLDGRIGTSDEERANNALLAARTANRLILPKKFPADKGKLFATLIILCLNDINSRTILIQDWETTHVIRSVFQVWSSGNTFNETKKI